MEEERLVEDVWIGDKSYLLTISDDVVSLTLIDLLDGADGPSAWADLLGGGGAGIGLVHAIDPVVHVEDHEPVGLLAHQHNVVLITQQSILVESVWYSLECFGELLLGLVDDQFVALLAIHVVFDPSEAQVSAQ